jgi:hypothetical protein
MTGPVQFSHMPNPSLAQSFFDEIRNAPDKIPFLSALVNPTQPRFEEEWLDFKQAPDLNSNDVQRNWSKALSGFANTGGGVLIWGIEAKKDPTTGIDCAFAVALIDNPAALKSRLKQLHHQATDPPVLDVVVEEYADSVGNGFVVCFVPESGFKPHRAEQDGKKQFYLRAGDDFVVMPVPVLRSMFFPRSKPNLRVEVRFADRNDEHSNITWTFRVHNNGTATARDVCLWIKALNKIGSPMVGTGRRHSATELTLGHAVACSYPIHPGTWEEFCYVIETSQPQPLQDYRERFRFRVFANDHEPQAAEVSFTHYDLVKRDPKFADPIEVAP